jgi:glycosyltransferase involved in cell wall biosynthesis
MKSEVPVLTSEKTSMEEAAGDAALYFNPNDHQNMADKMMLIYKDENLRNRLIEKGKSKAEKYNWEESAELFWECILKTIEE